MHVKRVRCCERVIAHDVINIITLVCFRCSQPAVGWLGWRSSEDEELVNAIAEACAYDTGSGKIIRLNKKQI